ncbi:unnamed protein product [Peniophora sp. CBMAI 1063]|nr:unnamed protein product [Peniophora sp. CBMAI 1063]
MPEPKKLNANYLLGDEPAEIKRLTSQHNFVKALFSNPTILPSCIPPSKIHRVLDAAAGTTAWALDLSDQPFASLYEIHACDITLSKFPPPDVLERAGIKTFEHDLTKPFGEEMKGAFDVVHASALVLALTEEGWRSMLRNVYDVLAPGGYLILADSDLLAYTADEDLPPDGTPYDIEERTSGSSAIHSMNNIIAGTALASGSVIGLSYRLHYLLSSSSFTTISRKRIPAPTGALLSAQPHLAPFREEFTANPVAILDTITSALLSQGKLEVPRGTKVESEEARRKFVRDVREEVERGIRVVASEWVAQK